MSPISRRAHGAIDYLFGLLLIISPWLFGFSNQDLASMVALVFGGGTILYSLLTNYEFGVVRLLPFSVHRIMDLGAGLMLAMNWAFFAFTGTAAVVFTIFGILELGVALFTRRSGPKTIPTMT